MKTTSGIQHQLQSLLTVPMEEWGRHGIILSAASCNSDGMVNSFFAKVSGQKWYGYRKHEYVNGAFTGKQCFVVEVR